VSPSAKSSAIRALVNSEAKTVIEYVEKFRRTLPSTVLNSSTYSFSVFLIPKTANRSSAADVAMEFVPYDSENPNHVEGLDRAITIIKEKHVLIGLKGYKNPET
jgi:hypothetical protein